MRLESSLAATIIFGIVGAASAYPDVDKLQRREQSDQDVSTQLIGDLKTLKDSQLTYTGRVIKALLQNSDNVPGPENSTTYPDPPPARDSDICKSDTCCIWKHIYNDMKKAMVNADRNCNDLARAAIRLGFHDAGTWSLETGPLGGADGSIILAGECESRDENRGMETICEQTRRWFDAYKHYGVGMADLIQMGHNVGTKLCFSGPSVRTFVGRKDRSTAAPEGNLPTQDQSADELIALFGNKTIAPVGLAALVGAHTSAKQRFVDVSRAGVPLDSTPEIWDTSFYDQTLTDEPPEGVFRLPSDAKLSRHPRTNPAWKSFSGFLGLFSWLRDYSREYVRLSLLGVDNINSLTECTRVLSDDPPAPVDPEPSTSTNVFSKPFTATNIFSESSTSTHVSSVSTTSTHTHISDDKKTATTTTERTRPGAVDTSQTSSPVATTVPSGSATGSKPSSSSSVTSHVPQDTVLSEADVKAMIELSTKFTFEVRGGLVAIHDLGKAAAVSWRLVYDLDASVQQRFRFEICKPHEQGRVVTKYQGQYIYGYALEINTAVSGVTQLLCDNGGLYYVEIKGNKVIDTKPAEVKLAQDKGRVVKCTGTDACQETKCKGDECNSNLVVSLKTTVNSTVSFTYEACQPAAECHCVWTCAENDCSVQKPSQGPARPPVPVDQARTAATALVSAVANSKVDETEVRIAAVPPGGRIVETDKPVPGVCTAPAAPAPSHALAANRASAPGSNALTQAATGRVVADSKVGSHPSNSTSAPSGAKVCITSEPVTQPSNVVVNSSGRVAAHILGVFVGLALVL